MSSTAQLSWPPLRLSRASPADPGLTTSTRPMRRTTCWWVWPYSTKSASASAKRASSALSGMDIVAARLPRRRMHQQQPLAADRPAPADAAGGEPLRQLRVDAVAGPGARRLAGRRNIPRDCRRSPARRAPLRIADHLVGKAVLLDAVAEADQLVDIAHQRSAWVKPRALQ